MPSACGAKHVDDHLGLRTDCGVLIYVVIM